MSKYVEEFKRAGAFKKISIVLRTVLPVLVIALSALGLLNVLPIEKTNSITLPLLGVVLLLTGITSFKTDDKAQKMLDVFLIGAAIFSFFVFAKITFM